jgi:tripartite-type tricarboxylate transporter receptor subunit TctC
MPSLRDGKIKAVATGGRTRTVALPQIPTMGESGLPGFVSETYFGLLGPAGMPKSIITQVNADAVKYLKTDEMRQRYQQNGADPMPGTPAEFEKIQRNEFVRVKRVIQDIDLKPQF